MARNSILFSRLSFPRLLMCNSLGIYSVRQNLNSIQTFKSLCFLVSSYVNYLSNDRRSAFSLLVPRLIERVVAFCLWQYFAHMSNLWYIFSQTQNGTRVASRYSNESTSFADFHWTKDVCFAGIEKSVLFSYLPQLAEFEKLNGSEEVHFSWDASRTAQSIICICTKK